MKKKPLIYKIFPGYLVIIILILTVSGLLTARKIRSFYLSETRQHLLSIAKLVERNIQVKFDQDNAVQLDSICKEFGKATDLRITFIDGWGVVIGDSQENPRSMENHADRPEIRDALQDSFGVSIRFSPTLQKRMMYLAIPYSQDGTLVGVVRTSIPVISIEETLSGIDSWILIIGVIVALISVIISYFVSRNITAPIKEMKEGAEKFASMKESIAQSVLDEIPNIIDQSYEYTTSALGIEEEMRTKMKSLSPAEFEGVLHPAFEEDEIQLIVLGGILGAIVGVIQLFTIFQL